MFIENVRLGHANNSSSSHSIWLTKTDKKTRFKKEHFGWDRFIISSPKGKMAYLASTIFSNISQNTGEELARVVVKELTGIELTSDYPYVDHQSLIEIPVRRDGHPNVEFIQELIKYFQEKELTILGGNDNDDKPYPIKNEFHRLGVQESKLKAITDISASIAEKDGDFWVLYQPNTGAKIRFSFKDNPVEEHPRLIELVDLKITNFCAYGCEFCYQNSTKQGKHADLEFIRDILYQLPACGTFEIAIGGGEPTTHPEFLNILKFVKEHGITPNFTTRNIKYLRDHYNELVNIGVGSVAISLEDIYTAKSIYALQNLFGGSLKLTAQIIPEVIPQNFLNELVKYLAEAGIPTTFLGFKYFGRAQERHLYGGNFISAIEAAGGRYFRYSVDTVLAQRTNFEELGIWKPSVYLLEGHRSFYIDAVEGYYAKSSYTDEVFPLGTAKNSFPNVQEAHKNFLTW